MLRQYGGMGAFGLAALLLMGCAQGRDVSPSVTTAPAKSEGSPSVSSRIPTETERQAVDIFLKWLALQSHSYPGSAPSLRATLFSSELAGSTLNRFQELRNALATQLGDCRTEERELILEHKTEFILGGANCPIKEVAYLQQVGWISASFTLEILRTDLRERYKIRRISSSFTDKAVTGTETSGFLMVEKGVMEWQGGDASNFYSDFARTTGGDQEAALVFELAGQEMDLRVSRKKHQVTLNDLDLGAID